jgi:hypothetical protein
VGLVRRVPGAGLAPGLRRSSGITPTGRAGARSGRVSPGGGGFGSTAGVAARLPDPADRQKVRSMLSRFQASQRAGRAVAETVEGSHLPEDRA